VKKPQDLITPSHIISSPGHESLCHGAVSVVVRRQNKDNFDKSSKIFYSWTTDQNAFIFGIEHPWGEEIQACSNKVPRIMYGSAPGAWTFT